MTEQKSSPTMKDVAREAGVALGTVSKVVNGIPVGREYRIRVEKAIKKLSLKAAAREDFGDCAKYVKFVAKDKDGNIHKIRPQINQDKIDEAMKYAGYNLLSFFSIFPEKT